ncbi:MAG: hypothetical protein WBF58_01915, partial [Xanthobacteraceae bacterium]
DPDAAFGFEAEPQRTSTPPNECGPGNRAVFVLSGNRLRGFGHGLAPDAGIFVSDETPIAHVHGAWRLPGLLQFVEERNRDAVLPTKLRNC